MSKLPIASFAGAMLCFVIPVTAQEQGSKLPDGAGKELVTNTCLACYRARNITRSSGYTSDTGKS